MLFYVLNPVIDVHFIKTDPPFLMTCGTGWSLDTASDTGIFLGPSTPIILNLATRSSSAEVGWVLGPGLEPLALVDL